MKENIKILEEYLDKQDRKFVSEYRLMILQAIENLIARNKELEKQMGKDLDVVYLQGVYNERDRWKSKVRDKVIEVKDRPVTNDFITATQGKLNTIIDLEDLLQEGDK